MHRRHRLRMALAAGPAVAASVVLTAPAAHGAEPAYCAQYAAESLAHQEHPTGSGRRTVVIGDSYSLGVGLRDTMLGWTSLIPGHVQVFGFGGSGFSSTASPCGADVDFARRAPEALRTHPDLVIVEGGLNDVFESDARIIAGFRELMAEVGGLPTLVIGPAPAPKRARSAARVDALLRSEAARVHATYVSMIGESFTYLRPRLLHLDLTSHREYAAIVTRALQALVRPTPAASPSPGPRSAAPSTAPTTTVAAPIGTGSAAPGSAAGGWASSQRVAALLGATFAAAATGNVLLRRRRAAARARARHKGSRPGRP